MKLDSINLGLIILSLILAWNIPFHLFLFAYAIIGPLHYLTEINWLHERNYFAKERNWIYWCLLLALLFCLPSLLSLIKNAQLTSFIDLSRTWINGTIWLAFIGSISLVLFKDTWKRFIFLLIGLLAILFLRKVDYFNIIIGLFLPTVIHVYLFTLILMFLGSLKSKSPIGYLSCIVMVMIPLAIWLVPVNMNLGVSESIKNTFLSSNFHVLNATVNRTIGNSEGTTFFFFEKSYYKVQIFISFAYLYHYLNWFSKVNLIGWNKTLTGNKVIQIISAWLVLVSVVVFNFQIGITILLVLSILHVFLEFPLNIHSINTIFHEISKRTKASSL